MFLSKLGYAIPLLAALSDAVILSRPTLTLIHPTIPISLPSDIPPASTPAATTGPPLVVPTPGSAPKNTTVTSHGLGGTTIPLTVTKTFEPMIWETIAVSNLTTPVGPPGSDPTAAAATDMPFSNATINTRDVALEKRLPAFVDWRNRGGLNWLTSIQDQGGCGSCWVFSATALIESMVRIQHGMWSKRGEGDFHDQMGVSCGQGGGPDFALTWAATTGGGVADKQCDEYDMDDKPWFPCGDRSGRTLRIPAYTSLNTVSDQKQWLVNVGPISACFNVYADFYRTPAAWAAGPYKYDGKSEIRGGHCILIVGYDDNAGVWMFRNSWGPGFGVKGYGTMVYGTAEIDNWTKFGMTNVNPDPWTRKRHHNGMLYQAGNGATHRNFEMVRANPAGGLTQAFRGGESPFQWGVASQLQARDEKTSVLLTGQYVNGQPSMLGSSFNRDFEVLFWGDHGTLNHWYYSESRPGWFFTGQLNYPWWEAQNQFAGYPGFVQTDDSNFAIVVRNSDGSLWESQRNSKTGAFTFQSVISGPATILQSGPALVQSNINLDQNDPMSAGNLYVVSILSSGKMQMFYRASTSDPSSFINTTWIPTEIFGSGIGDTAPVMIQDYWRTTDENTPGGFQLLVAVNGVVQHWQRVNTDIVSNPPRAGGPGRWQHVLTFGNNVKHVWSLVHGSNNQALEAVVEEWGAQLWHWQYTNAGWNRVALIPS